MVTPTRLPKAFAFLCPITAYYCLCARQSPPSVTPACLEEMHSFVHGTYGMKSSLSSLPALSYHHHHYHIIIITIISSPSCHYRHHHSITITIISSPSQPYHHHCYHVITSTSSPSLSYHHHHIITITITSLPSPSLSYHHRQYHINTISIISPPLLSHLHHHNQTPRVDSARRTIPASRCKHNPTFPQRQDLHVAADDSGVR